MFMDQESVRECILTIKMKNSEGFGGIPQRVLVDEAEIILPTFTGLFARIYSQVQIKT